MIKGLEHDYNKYKNLVRLFYIIQLLNRMMGNYNFLSNTILVNIKKKKQKNKLKCFFVVCFGLKTISCPEYLSEGSLDSSASLPNSPR